MLKELNKYISKLNYIWGTGIIKQWVGRNREIEMVCASKAFALKLSPHLTRSTLMTGVAVGVFWVVRQLTHSALLIN